MGMCVGRGVMTKINGGDDDGNEDMVMWLMDVMLL